MAQVPGNKAIAQLASQNPISSALVPGLSTAKTFYTASQTHDGSTALNSRLIKYLEDAVNAIAKKQDATKVVDTLNLGFNQVLSQYRLVNPLPTPRPNSMAASLQLAVKKTLAYSRHFGLPMGPENYISGSFLPAPFP